MQWRVVVKCRCDSQLNNTPKLNPWITPAKHRVLKLRWSPQSTVRSRATLIDLKPQHFGLSRDDCSHGVISCNFYYMSV